MLITAHYHNVYFLKNCTKPPTLLEDKALSSGLFPRSHCSQQSDNKHLFVSHPS